MNPRQMKQMMKRLGIEQEDLGEVDEVIIRTADKEYTFRNAAVTAMVAQGQRIWQVIGEPIVRPRHDTAKKEEPPKTTAIPTTMTQVKTLLAFERRTSSMKRRYDLL